MGEAIALEPSHVSQDRHSSRNTRKLIWLFCVVAFFFVPGCSDSDVANQPVALPERPVQPGPNSVVRVETNSSTGSGFVFRHNGQLYIGTAAHVVEDAATADVRIELPSGQEGSPKKIVGLDRVKIAAIDFDADVAVLRVGAQNLGGLLVPLKANPANCAKAVVAHGYPSTSLTEAGRQGWTRTRLSGVKAAPLNAHDSVHGMWRTYKRGTVDGVLFRPALAPGHSGGPVVDRDGAVVAVVTTRSGVEGKSTATCISHLGELLSATPTGPPMLKPAAANSLIEELRDKFLAYGSDVDWTATPHDYILPSSLAQYRRLVRMFVDFRSSLTGFPGHDKEIKPAELARVNKYLDRAWEGYFPGLTAWTSSNPSECGEQILRSYSGCLARQLGYQMAMRATKKQLSWLANKNTTYSLVGQPQLISRNPYVYEFVLSGMEEGAERVAQKLRFRWEAGRYWYVPDDAMESFKALLEDAEAQEERRSRLIDKFTGFFSTEVDKVKHKLIFDGGCGYAMWSAEHLQLMLTIKASETYDVVATMTRRVKARQTRSRSSCWDKMILKCGGRTRSRHTVTITTKFTGTIDEFGTLTLKQSAYRTEPPDCEAVPGVGVNLRSPLFLTFDGEKSLACTSQSGRCALGFLGSGAVNDNAYAVTGFRKW